MFLFAERKLIEKKLSRNKLKIDLVCRKNKTFPWIKIRIKRHVLGLLNVLMVSVRAQESVVICVKMLQSATGSMNFKVS